MLQAACRRVVGCGSSVLRDQSSRLISMKRCSKCGESKPLDEFPSRKGSLDGRRNECRSCTRAFHRSWSDRNRDHVKAKRELLVANTPPRSQQLCPTCQRTKPASEFRPERLRPGGLQGRCKACQDNSIKRWRETNKEHSNEYQRSRYHRNPIVRERNLELARKWAARNPEKVRAAKQGYKRRNPDVQRMACIRRRSRIKGSTGNLTEQQWHAILDLAGHACLACGASATTVKLTVDHVVPLAAGGSNSPSNIQVLCMSCNGRKSTQSTDYRDDRLRTAFSAIESTGLPPRSRRPARR